ncbi:acyltransferase [Neorhizobium sp. BT27B]|uniref:acyltransferase family protein n=1 Tax=Neorhizobium sp. BT27B TaxID=3142625 RepID=UPI003D2BEDF8
MGVLRLYLALSVVMSHGLTTLLGIHLLDGAGAVLVFFTISGFLITVGLNKKYAATRLGRLHFYWNRAIRLYPMYWAWLIITVLLYLTVATAIEYQKVVIDGSREAAMFWSEHANAASSGTLLLAALGNITGLFIDSFLALDLARETGQLIPRSADGAWAMGFIFIGQYWTIGVEIVFYLVAPWVVTRPLLSAVILALSATGYLGRAWLWLVWYLGLPLALEHLRAPDHLWFFMLGSLLAGAYMEITSSDRRPRISFGLMVCAFGGVAIFGDTLFPTADFPWWQFVGLTLTIPILFSLTSGGKVDGFIGDLSYPVYIVHFQVIQMLGTYFQPSGLLFAVASVAIAVPMVLLIDRRANHLKWQSPPHPTAAASAAYRSQLP